MVNNILYKFVLQWRSVAKTANIIVMPKIILAKNRVPSSSSVKRESVSSIYVKNIVPVVLNLALLGFSFFMFYNIGKSIYIAGQKLEIIEQANQEVTSLRLDNIKLVMEKSKVSDSDYIEIEARNRLNYAKQGEVQFIISEKLMDEYKNAEVLGLSDSSNSVEKELTTQERVKVWEEFLLSGF
jgi:cell division protein FtsB